MRAAVLLAAVQKHHVWLTRHMSPVRDELTKVGWRLQDGGRLWPAQLSGWEEKPYAEGLRISWTL